MIPAFRTLLLLAFGALIAFGAVLRFLKLTGVGLWYDELWTVVGASNRPFMEMYREWILGDAHPPGYFLFYFAWLKLVPNTEFWARVPNAVAGVATVAYCCGERKGPHQRGHVRHDASLSYIYVFYALSVPRDAALCNDRHITYLEITQLAADRCWASRWAPLAWPLAYLNHFAMVYVASAGCSRSRFATRASNCGESRASASVGYPPIVFPLIQVKYSIDDWQPYRSTLPVGLLLSMFFATRYSWRRLGVLAAFLVLGRRPYTGAPRHSAETPSARQDGTVTCRHRGRLTFHAHTRDGEAHLLRPLFPGRPPPLFLGLGTLRLRRFPSIEAGWRFCRWHFSRGRRAVRSAEGMQRQEWDKSVDFVLKASPMSGSCSARNGPDGVRLPQGRR